MSITNTKTGAPLAPGAMVNVSDVHGKVTTMPSAQADKLVSDPNSGMQVASPEETNAYNNQQKFGGTGQTMLAGAEHLANGATFGTAVPIIHQVLSGIDQALGDQYQVAQGKRTQQSPIASTVGEVGGMVVDPVNLMSGLSEAAHLVAPKILTNTAGNFLAKAAQKTILGSVEGGGYGALSTILPSVIDGNPVGSDVMYDSVGKNMLMFGVMHGAFSLAQDGLQAVDNAKIHGKNFLDKTINKYADPSSGEVPGISTKPVKIGELKPSETPLGQKGTTFTVNPQDPNVQSADPTNPTAAPPIETYTHTNGNKATVINSGNVQGNGADFTTPQGLQDIGDKNGISDFDVKHRVLKGADVSDKDFLIQTKQNQIKVDWLNKNEAALTPDEQNVLGQHDALLTMLKTHPDDGLLQQHFQVVNSTIDNLTESVQKKSPVDRGALNDSLVKNELEQMSYEVKNAERTQGLMVDSNGEVNNRYDENSYPDYYHKVGAKNTQDFEKILRSGKGKRFERIVELAKGRLENGYESPQSGPVMPNADYFTGTAEEGQALRIPIKEQQMLKGKLSQVESGVKDFVGTLDHAKTSEGLHVFNPDSVKGEFTETKTVPPLSDNAKQVASDLNVANKYQERQSYNNVADYIKNELYPKTADQIAGNQHALDYIAETNKTNLANYGDKLDKVFTEATNVLERSGKGTTLTHEDIAKFIEGPIMDQYRDLRTGNAKVNFETQFNQLQKYADSFKANGFDYTGKYNSKTYHAIPVDELRQMRIDIDQKAKWENPEAGLVPEAARQLRDHVETHIIDSISKNSPQLKADYLKAKHNVHMALQADAIIGQATVKGIQKATAGSRNILGSMIGGKIGTMVGGPMGGILGYHLGGQVGVGSEAVGMLNGYNTAIRNHLSETLNTAFTKYDGHMTRAAAGILNSRPGNYVDNKSAKQYTYDAIKKDTLGLQQAKQNLPDNLNSMMDQNSGLYTMAPQTMSGMMATAGKANDFLISKLPVNPYQGIPWRQDKWEPSQMEISKYFRFKEAVEKPSSILNQLQNGSITPEAIEVLKTVYPQTLQAMEGKVMSAIDPKKDIPQEKRLMIYKVFGVPMDTYSQGKLFGEFQQTASNMIVSEAQNANPTNMRKTQKSMDMLTPGNNTLMKQD